MTDSVTLAERLSRPRLLIRAARFGQQDYNRSRDLKRLMRTAVVPSPERALPVLIEEEGRLEETRRAGDSGYSLTRHIELLIALMGELRLIPRSTAPV